MVHWQPAYLTTDTAAVTLAAADTITLHRLHAERSWLEGELAALLDARTIDLVLTAADGGCGFHQEIITP